MGAASCVCNKNSENNEEIIVNRNLEKNLSDKNLILKDSTEMGTSEQYRVKAGGNNMKKSIGNEYETPDGNYKSKKHQNSNGQYDPKEQHKVVIETNEDLTKTIDVEETDFDYHYYAKEIFNIYNQMRMNPQNYLAKVTGSKYK